MTLRRADVQLATSPVISSYFYKPQDTSFPDRHHILVLLPSSKYSLQRPGMKHPQHNNLSLPQQPHFVPYATNDSTMAVSFFLVPEHRIFLAEAACILRDIP